MAEHNSPLYTKQTAALGGKMLPTDFGGRVRCVRDCVELVSSAAIGDVINLIRLPKGAKLLDDSELYFPAGLGASVTVKVGDSGDDDRYLAAVAVGNTAKTIRLDALKLSAGYALTAEDVITLTVGVAAIAANTKIGVNLKYVVD